MKTDFLIIGGGVAGLSAANRLADCGSDVTLLEAGEYPAHKICGEFISPEALSILEKWEITPASFVNSMLCNTRGKEWNMEFPRKSATLMRYILDESLAKRASENGARVQVNAQVDSVEIPKNKDQPYVVTLTSGEEWISPILLISTGRLVGKLTKQKQPRFCYIGAKAHFNGIDTSNKLLMHLMPGAYFGMASIGLDRINIAGLIACTEEESRDPKKTLCSFLNRNSSKEFSDILNKGELLFQDWMVSPVPEFGVRKCPHWPNAFFLGDAAGAIPPATGNGLAMGLTSGILAADYALKKQPDLYRAHWNKEYRNRILRGMLLHKLFLSSLSKAIPFTNNLISSLSHYIFNSTRGS